LTEGSGDSAEFVIPEASECLAEALRDKGYATCAISANWLLDAHSGVLQGFSEQVVLNHHLRRRNVFSEALPGLEAMGQWVTRRPEHACLMDTSQVVLRYLDRFLEHHPGGPFFVWLHFMDPHDPYAPPARYRSRWVKREGPWPVFAPHDASVGTPTDAEIRAGIAVLAPDAREYVKDLYEAEVAYADDLLGEVRRMVEDTSGKRPVIWCVSADHGEEFWEHGSYYHGQSLYDELIHVPLVIAAAGASKGLRADEPVALLDVMPTLADLCGVSVPQGFEGRSLAGRLRGGEAPAPAPIFSDSNAYYEPMEAIVSGGFKLVRHRESERVELYDLRRDPGERNNLARADMRREYYAELTRLLLVLELDKWRANLRPAHEQRSRKIHKEQRERMKSLGYL
jgi:arylsulfatase A-like enzyme